MKSKSRQLPVNQILNDKNNVMNFSRTGNNIFFEFTREKSHIT